MAFADLPLERRSHTSEARVLLAALHLDRTRLDESGIERLTNDQWEELVTVAGYQRVRPLLHQRLFETGKWQLAPDASWQRLGDECRAIAMRKIRAHAELAAILTSLNGAGIQAILLKGAHLGPLIYKNVALREMNDLDIMVRRDHIAESVALVTALGYEGLREFSVTSDIRTSHHVTRLIKQGVAGVELHWNITAPQTETSIDPASLWQRAEPIVMHGQDTLGLSPADLVLHLCFHAAFQHNFEFGLRPSLDVAHTIAHSSRQLDWETVRQTAELRGWSRGVALALQLARDFVGAEVPEHVIQEMAPLGLEPGITLARQQTWWTPSEINSFPVNLAALGGGETLRAGFRAALGRVFLPRDELTTTYHVRDDAWWWPALFGYRIVDLVWRRASVSLRLVSGRDPALSDLARRRNRIRTWLA